MSTNINKVVSSKRRRTAASTIMRINDLPDGILTNVATYLATPSVVLFAIAIQQDGASLTQTSKAIMSATTSASNGGEQQQLQVLDFGDIEKSLAAKLTDDHITTILNCISASNNLKTLKLAGCINITGSCLEVIRSSAVLELLDLSLVRMHEGPVLDPEPLLSESVVIPILDHIIGNGRRSLKLLHLPKKFRMSESETEEFLGRYNDYLETFSYKCSKCDTICDETGAESWTFQDDSGEYKGAQNYTCSGCLAHFCFDDDCHDEDGIVFVEWCIKCENHYCKDCVPSNDCKGCYQSYCNKCDALEKECDDGDCEANLCKTCSQKRSCWYCNQTKCRGCIISHSCSRDGCNKVICNDCVESKGEGGQCNKCFAKFCSAECRYLKCSKDWERACTTCMRDSAISFRGKYQESQKEIEELSHGMEDLYKKYMNVDKEEEE